MYLNCLAGGEHCVFVRIITAIIIISCCMLGYKHMKMAISVACNPVEHDRCAEINTYKDK